MSPFFGTIPLSDGYPCHATLFAPSGEKLGHSYFPTGNEGDSPLFQTAEKGDSPLPSLLLAHRPVLYLHGIQSHAGWFTQSASMLATAGYAVFMPDRRGSGANTAARGHTRSLGQLLDDGRIYLDRASKLGGLAAPLAAMSSPSDSPPQHACDKTTVAGMTPAQAKNESAESAKSAGKIHLLGVSWGGKWALALAAKYPERVASLTLSTPGLYSKRTVNFATRLAIAACALVSPTRQFALPLNEPELFSDVPRWQQFIADDPLRLRSASARFLAISQWMQHLLPRWAAAVRCPVLLLLADRDPIINNERTAGLLASHLPADRLTVKRFPAAVHTLEFSADPSHYFQTIIEWINQQESSQ